MQIINAYQTFIDTQKNEKKLDIENLLKNHCKDDATFKQVELNIIEIFEKMFENSVKKVKSEDTHPTGTLKTTFLSFFDMIPQNWHSALEQHRKFENEEGIHLETLKIEQANALKREFLSLFDEVSHDAY